MKYDQLIASGTFDLFHKGHKSFLEKSFEVTDEVIVCITSNSYVKSFKDLKDIEDFEIRKKTVLQFLTSIGVADRAKIISIDDVFGPLLTRQFDPNAIAVTPQTEKTAIEINEKRKELDLPQLEIIVIEMEKADDGGLISSTRIRKGEINRGGRLYVRNNWRDKTLKLPQNLRPVLQKPLGKLLSWVPSGVDGSKAITIGDISTQKFNEKNVGQFLSVVDFKVHREKMFEKLSDLGFVEDIETIKVGNPAGTITWDLFEAVQKAFSTENRKIILVKGEEDLAVLPALLISPLGFTVYYGQPAYAEASSDAKALADRSAGRPNEGLVEVPVTEQNKEKAYDLVSKFTSQS
ncbi:MAG: pantetheine-phosphate adenylyltransferase [Candidatus Levybacteria bacterium]|nr:pantetheine-phosphate adenylyltransferase [Candidatus Levybacteria bacterium]